MSMIKLESADGEVFETDVRIAKCFGIIKKMLEHCRFDEENGAKIPLPKVNSVILRRLLQWANHHINDPAQFEDESENEIDSISQWDADFLQEDDPFTLTELNAAANYLDIKGLFDVTAKTIAKMMKGKKQAEVLQMFTIKNNCKRAEDERIQLEK